MRIVVGEGKVTTGVEVDYLALELLHHLPSEKAATTIGGSYIMVAKL